MATPESELRGTQRRDGAAQASLENFTREIRKHGLTASTVALILAIAGMGHDVPGVSVVAAVALLFLALRRRRTQRTGTIRRFLVSDPRP